MTEFEPKPVDINEAGATAVDSSPEKDAADESKSSANANNKRLYLNNVSYETTEEDLLEFLKEFEV